MLRVLYRYHIMQLPTFSSKPKQTTPTTSTSKRFFACQVDDGLLTLAIWSVENGKTTVEKIGTSKEWQELSEFIDAFELGIEEFKESADDIEGVFFSLPENWVKDDEVQGEYKKTLQQLQERLALKVLGFVVTTEALIHFLAKKNQGNVSALVLEFFASALQLSLVVRNTVTHQEQIGRSGHLAEDLIEGLTRIARKPYPAQLFFYSPTFTAEQLEEEKQSFLAHEWEPTGPFPHLPTIQVISKKQLIQAICETAGGQIAQSMGLVQPPAKESATVKDEDGEDFGFEELAQHQNIHPVGAPVVPAGKVESAEEADEPKKSRFAFSLPFMKKKTTEAEVVEVEEDEDEPEFAIDDDAPPSRFKKMGMIAGGVLVLLLVTGGASSFYLRSQTEAVVEVILNTERVSSEIEITLDPDIDETDPEENILKAQPDSKTVTGQQETSTTGSKIIGEKAKGTVTLFNRTENDKTFAQGTELTAGKVVFLLDEEVTVASGTAKEDKDFNKTLEPGKKDVSVTAKDIGAEGNLSENTEFTVSNFAKDTYVARNEEALTGGSSREIQAVSESDQRNLRQSLLKELQEQADKELDEEQEEGVYIVLTGNTTIEDESFSAKVGDETNTLKLSMTLEVEAYSYKNEDLQPIAESNLSSQVPDGGALLTDSISILSRENEQSTSSATIALDAQISADFTPPTDTNAWLTEITGKTKEQAESILKSKSEIKSATVQIKPRISAILFGKLPGSSDKIQVNKKVE